MDNRVTQIKGPEDRKVDDDAQGLASKRWHKQTISLKKKEDEEYSTALTIAWIYQSENYIKKSKERQMIVASNSTDNIKINRTTKCRKQKWEEK